MSQSIPSTINPNTTSGTQLASILDGFVLAVASGFSGTSRPSNLQTYGYWIDTTDELSDLVSYKFYDGTTDHELFKINISTGQLILAEADATLEIVKTSDDAIGALFTLQKKRVSGGGQVLTSDVIGELLFKSTDDSDVSHIAAKITSVSLDNVLAAVYGAYLSFYTTSAGGNSTTEKMRITGDGKMGLGVIAPEKSLHVEGSGSDVAALIRRDEDGADPVELILAKKRATTDNGQIKSGDSIARIPIKTVDQNGAEIEVGVIEYDAIEDHTDVAQGTKVSIKVKGATDAAYTTVFEANGDDLLLKGYLSDRLEFSAIATPGDTPAAGKYFVYVKSDGQMYIKNDADLEKALGGGGAGGRTENYVDDFDFSAGTLGASWGDSGGNLTVAYESGSPLRGTGSAKITAASAAVDDYVKYGPFTLDTIDHTQVLNLVMDQLGNSNLEDDDIHWKIVADPAGTPTVVGSLKDLGLVKAGVPKLISQYQALPSSEGTDYELRAYNTRATASYELTIDNIEFKNQDYISGGAATKEVMKASGTPGTTTLNSGTVYHVYFSTTDKDSRNGIDQGVAGAATTVYNDAWKYVLQESGDIDWSVNLYIFSTGWNGSETITLDIRVDNTAKATRTFSPNNGTAADPMVSLSGSFVNLSKGAKISVSVRQNSGNTATFGTNPAFNFFNVEVKNPESAQGMIGSDLLSYFKVGLSGAHSTNSSIQDLPFDNIIEEINNGKGYFDTLNNKYVATATHSVGVKLYTTWIGNTATGRFNYIHTGGTQRYRAGSSHTGTGSYTDYVTASAKKIDLVAGDEIKFQGFSSGLLALQSATNSSFNHAEIIELPETSSGIVPEQATNMMRGYVASQSIPDATETTMAFTVSYDDTNSYDDINDRYYPDTSGRYEISLRYLFSAATAWDAGEFSYALIRVTRADTSIENYTLAIKEVEDGAPSMFHGKSAYDVLEFEKGDYFEIKLYQNSSLSLGLHGSQSNVLTVRKVK